MREVELVIKIPEKLYESVMDGTYCGTLYQELKNGTPLPKDHGRVIDYGYVVDAIDDWINAGEYNYTNATDYLRKRIRNTPTIIEADRSEES